MTIFSFENLYKAYLDCRKNKRNKTDALLFEINAEENLDILCSQLLERTYYPSTSLCFVNKKPKLREIFAADFKDRIIHHLLVRYLEKVWEPVFIFDSYASRKAKGIHSGIKRLQNFTQKATKNKTIISYYMQLDIRSFFMQIDKNILYNLIKSRCSDQDTLWLSKIIIFHDPALDYRLKSSKLLLSRIPLHKSLFGIPKGRGLPIGNLTSQFFANIYLNELDQFIKHKLKCRFYMRYVDDFILIDRQKNTLINWQKEIIRFLDDKLKLSLNHTRTRMQLISNGIDFLGYIVRPSYVLVRKRVVNNFKIRLKYFKIRLITYQQDMVIVKYDYQLLDELFACINSYLSHFQHANTYRLIESVFKKYDYLKHYFSYKTGSLKRLYISSIKFKSLKNQYFYFLKQFLGSIVFFQVGYFYEFYGLQAITVSKLFNIKMLKCEYGFKYRCGIHKQMIKKYVLKALKERKSVTVINQTGRVLDNILERKAYVYYTYE